MLFFFISVIFITFSCSYSIKQSEISSIQYSPANLPLYQAIYTVDSNLCSFPFDYLGKVYYDCIPEFKKTPKQEKILFFWCFYSDKLDNKLKKGYCTNGNPLESGKLIENKLSSEEFLYISSKNKDFQRFLQFFLTEKKDFICKKSCFEDLIRVLHDKFTKKEILRIKMEVYAKIQGFSNISLIKHIKNDNFDENKDYINDLGYNYMFWTDFTLINKLFRLFYNKEIDFLDIYSDYPLENGLLGYESFEKLTIHYKTLYKQSILIINKEIDDLNSAYNDFLSKTANLQRDLHLINEEFLLFTKEMIENITKGINQIELLEKERKSLKNTLNLKEIQLSNQKALYYEYFNEIEDDLYLNLPNAPFKPPISSKITRINCNKACNSYFTPCFHKEIWVYSSCYNACSYYKWDYNTLKCLKPFLKSDFCENKGVLAHIFDFCLLSGDFQLIEALKEGIWVKSPNEISFLKNEQSSFDLTESFYENPIVFLTDNKEIFIEIDPFYLEFNGFLMKLYPLKSHLRNPFLYYPLNKQRKSLIITVLAPDFSYQKPGFLSNNSILYMKGDLQGDLLQGALLMRKLHDFCEKPKVIGAEVLGFRRRSHVFLDLSFYFTEYPIFIEENWYLVEISGYYNDIIDIKVKETVEMLLAVENIGILNEINLAFIEALINEGWVLIKEAFDKRNMVYISSKGGFELEKGLIKKCYWDEGLMDSLCGDYKVKNDENEDKSFILWSKTMVKGDSFKVNTGFLMIIPFIKSLSCVKELELCTKGKNIIKIDVEIPFIKVITNINDCIWGLDDLGGLLYRRNIGESNRKGENWVSLEGFYKSIALSSDNLWALTKDNRILIKEGLFEKGFCSIGKEWRVLKEFEPEDLLTLTMIKSSNIGCLWALDSEDNLLFLEKGLTIIKVEKGVSSFEIGEKILIIYKNNGKLLYRDHLYDRINKKCVIGEVNEYYEISPFQIESLTMNLKGCIWGLDDLGSLLIRKSLNSTNKIGMEWQIVFNITNSIGFKDLSINERDLWLISLDGDPYILPNICL